MGLTEKERKALVLFERALIDWLADYNPVTFRGKITRLGLCHYFNQLWFDNSIEYVANDLREYWVEFRTRDKAGSSGFDFPGYGYEPEGRKERVEALRKTIDKLNRKDSGVEYFECSECGELAMKKTGEHTYLTSATYECEACGNTESFP